MDEGSIPPGFFWDFSQKFFFVIPTKDFSEIPPEALSGISPRISSGINPAVLSVIMQHHEIPPDISPVSPTEGPSRIR